MNFEESRIAKMLLDQGLLDQFQYQAVRDHQSQYGGKFHLLAVELGMVPEDKITRLVAQVTGCQQVSLAKMPVDRDALEKLPASFCIERDLYPCALRDAGSTLWLAMADPTDTKSRTEAQVLSGLNVRPLAGKPSEIREALERDYGAKDQEAIPFVSGTLDLGEPDEEEFKVTDLSGKTAVKHVSQVSGRDVPANQDALVAANQKLDRLLENQERIDFILEKVIELFMEKRFFDQVDLQERMKP